EVFVIACEPVDVDERELLGAAQVVEGVAGDRHGAAHLVPARRVEAAAVPEHGAHAGGVLPRRHQLEHVQLLGDQLEREERAAQRPDRRTEVAVADLGSRRLDLRRAELQPQLGRLVCDLEQELVVVVSFVLGLLQRKQLVGAEVPLVIARAGAREDRAEVVLEAGLLAPGHVLSILRRMGDLFADAARERLPDTSPLAQRARPATLDEVVGERHVLGERSALRFAIEQDRVVSMVFYGPPGSGKTTLARIVAARTGAAFVELSAVSATVAQVREVLAQARERLGAQGQRTILFLDEIHRFNKAQQDALLPAVEAGLVTL